MDWSRRAQAYVDAGLAPDSPEGAELAAEIARASASAGQDPDSAAFRTWLADQFASGADERAERYWVLLGIINGWPPFPSQQAAARWLISALRASTAR